MKYADYATYPVPSWHPFSHGFDKAADAFIRAFATIELWRSRSNERRRLAEFDDRLLKDIGVSRADAWKEANKPFWKA